MSKIELIEQAIEKALRRESKLTPLAMSVPALSSLNIRHLMNNLGAISKQYLDIGIHRGGLFCSTICNNSNLELAVAVDNWASDETSNEAAKPDFLENYKLVSPSALNVGVWHCDAFPDKANVDCLKSNIDLYLYDAGHDEESQCKALTHWIDAMAEEFIFCVDDWDFPEVEAGTWRGIKESGIEILFSFIAVGNNHDNEGMWNGFAVFLLKKKQ